MLVFHSQPQWHHVDSICTFIFSIFVIISTLNVLKDAILILMEGMYDNEGYKGLFEGGKSSVPAAVCK